MSITKNSIKKRLLMGMWVLIACGCITLLVSAMQMKNSVKCKAIIITIESAGNQYFIDKNDIYAIVKMYGGDTNHTQLITAIDIKKIELELEKQEWITNAELYFDNTNSLQIAVKERAPIARVFATNGSSFYIDSSCKVLPLSNKVAVLLPIFTSYIGVAAAPNRTDSTMLKSIKNLGQQIKRDSFLMALIEQIDILPNGQFELVPKVGNQTIYFGADEDSEAKFKKLKLFYKNVIPKVGWNRYADINLQYKNQVVAKLKGAADILTDSLQTLVIMNKIVELAKQKSADSSLTFLPDADKNSNDSAVIAQSIERDEEQVTTATQVIVNNTQQNVTKPTTNAAKAIPTLTPVKNPVVIAVAKKATAVATKVKLPDKKTNKKR